jgi:uncharacterized protein (TIGR03086 family)
MMNAIDLDRRAAPTTAAIIEAISPDDYAAPTPCGDWTVRHLLTHLIAGNVKYIEIGRGKEWARGSPDVALEDDPGRMYRRTFEAMLDAWEQPGVLERETPLPIGRGRAELALFLHVGETLVHGWDLARATQQQPQWDAEVVESCLTQYSSWLPRQRPPIERLAAYLGRDVGTWSA